MTIAPDKPKRRPWYQYSLRSLIFLMTAACVALVWLAYERNEVRKRETAIAAIKKLGGNVYFDVSQPFPDKEEAKAMLSRLRSGKPSSATKRSAAEGKRNASDGKGSATDGKGSAAEGKGK